MAELGPMADARQTLWTDRVQVAFVQHKIGAAKPARVLISFARCSARRTTDNGRIVGSRRVDAQYFAAMAAESLADLVFRDLIPPLAATASNENPHGSHTLGPIT